MPFFAAESAVTCAANGVLLREPLKPAPPAVSHAITLPCLSVSVTIVLLNDVLMCACPTAMFFRTRRRVRPRVTFWRAMVSLLLALPADGLLRPLAGARVGLGALPVDGQAAPVPQPAVAGDVHQALDVIGALPAEVALHHQLALDHVAKPRHLGLGEVADVGVGVDAGALQDVVRGGTADPVDVGQSDLHALLARDVDAGDSGHAASPASACGVGSGRSRAPCRGA